MRRPVLILTVMLLALVLATPRLRAQFDYTDTICKTATVGGQDRFTCVGIDRNRGGAISHLSTDWYLFNLVDNGLPDNGRQVQASFYREGTVYPPCWPCNSGCNWGWNPVQGGSCSSTSGYYNIETTTQSIFTQTQPLQWDNGLGRSNFFVGQYLRFVNYNTLEITYQLWNDESFNTGNASHELPVAYLEPILGVARAYTGSQPYTNGSVSTLSVAQNSFVTVNATERWVGWFLSNGKGVALYVPATPYPQTWRMGRLGSSSVPATSYMQNWAGWNLQPDTPYATTVYLITGTVAEIRASVYALEGH
jgi:hypothetical protein